MPELNTKRTANSVADYLGSAENEARRADAAALDALFQRVTGWEPRLWGSSIVGYGRYRYTYESGRSGEMCAVGFSLRKADIVVYVLSGYTDLGDRLARLGKHKLGKSCVYFKRLPDIDQVVLEEIIRAGLVDLKSRWPVDAG